MAKFEKGNQVKKGKFKDPQIDDARKFTRTKWEAAIHKYMHMSEGELLNLMKSPGDTPAFEMIVVNVLARAVGRGDVQRSEFILNRIIGKVPDKFEHDINKPTIMVRQDGSEVIFTTMPKKDDEQGWGLSSRRQVDMHVVWGLLFIHQTINR